MIGRFSASVIAPSGGQRFVALDGLRALAALGILLLHYNVLSWQPALAYQTRDSIIRRRGRYRRRIRE